MEKIWLVVKREYWTRVRRRSFILATLLTPLVFGLFVLVIQLIFGYESDDRKTFAILDQSDLIQGAIADGTNIYFKQVSGDVDALRQAVITENYDGLIVLPPLDDPLQSSYRARLYSDEKISLEARSLLVSRIRRIVREYKIEALELETRALEALNTQIDIVSHSLATDESEGNSMEGNIAAVLGVGMGLIMYITVFIYGMMVMRSVMEEKTNRIVEIMISSIRPFSLMLGKIVGVGAVGLTQVAAWAVLVPLFSSIVLLFFGFQASTPELATQPEAFNAEEAQILVEEAMIALGQLQWGLIVPLFFLYFLGGYFMYAALFAAVGSAMGDDLGEGQTLTIPITIPVVLAFYIMIAAIQSPNSSLAIFASMFPLFSPIVMPSRLPFGPPWWEILVSVLLLIGAAIALVWLSGRIYRIGILTYGKKVGLRQLGKWLVARN